MLSDTAIAAKIAPGIAQLQPYQPGKPLSELERELGIRDSIKLASNENPLGCSPAARAALQCGIDQVARYPDGGGFALRQALAAHHRVGSDWITLGNGSNDLLDMIARVFLYPGRESLFSQYAFAVYPISSQAVGATLSIAPAHDYGHHLTAMAERVTADTGVVWIANPNNPTGTHLSGEQLYPFLAALPREVIVVIDEAYIEYAAGAHPDATQWLPEFPNLIVTRTFSKAYGLAGLRIGYSLSHPAIAELLNRVRQPFNANALAQAAALAALGDQAFIAASVALNRAGMEQLQAGFTALGLCYIPSKGNFIALDLGRPAAAIDQALLREGCITRPIAGYGLPNHLRISIGSEAENARLLTTLAGLLAPC